MTARVTALVLLLVLLAALTPWLLRLAGPARPALTPDADIRAWFDARAARFAGYEYVSIVDQGRLEAIVRGWLRNPTVNLTPEVESRLISAVVGLLAALAAEDPQQYLRAVAVTRVPRRDVQSDSYMHLRHRQLTGAVAPSSCSAEELLRVFFTGRPDAPHRPAAVSVAGVMDVAHTLPADVQNLSDEEVVAATLPRLFGSANVEEYLDRWQSPGGQALVRVTDPIDGLSTVLRRHGKTLGCEFRCVVRLADGQYAMLSAYLYYAPDRDVWHVKVVGIQHPRPVFWPI